MREFFYIFSNDNKSKNISQKLDRCILSIQSEKFIENIPDVLKYFKYILIDFENDWNELSYREKIIYGVEFFKKYINFQIYFVKQYMKYIYNIDIYFEKGHHELLVYNGVAGYDSEMDKIIYSFFFHFKERFQSKIRFSNNTFS